MVLGDSAHALPPVAPGTGRARIRNARPKIEQDAAPTPCFGLGSGVTSPLLVSPCSGEADRSTPKPRASEGTRSAKDEDEGGGESTRRQKSQQELMWEARELLSGLKDSPVPTDSAEPEADEADAVSAHAPANRPPVPPSRLTGYKRNKLTLEQEWAAIRKEYGSSSKMFVIDGSFPGVRDALLDRGWAEHHEMDSMCFDFKWTIKTGAIDFQRLQPTQIVNHFKKNRAVTTKVGLSRSLRALKWFEEVDSDSFFPRSYDLDDLEDVHTFVEDFMLVAAQNAVLSFLSASSPPSPASTRRATLGLTACEDFVRHWEADPDLDGDEDWADADSEQDEDDVRETTLHGAPSRLSASEWSLVLGEECPIAAVRFVVGGEVAETCMQAVANKSSSLASLLRGLRECGISSAGGGSPTSARRKEGNASPHAGVAGREENGGGLGGIGDVMGDMTAFRVHAEKVLAKVRQMQGPQAGLNGRNNLWILKPAGKSRGRGIQVKSRLQDILEHVTDARGNNGHSVERWIVQKYIEDPLLVRGHKFDIRQWVLVSDWNPLSVWMYDECYLRFALSKYQTTNLTDRFAHLCNNCVQSTAPGFHTQREESMWDLKQFCAWLASPESPSPSGARVWEDVVLPQVRNIAAWAVMCAQDVLENRKESCELYGYDLVLDSRFHVWLLEVNSSPDMAPTTLVTERL